MIEKRKQKDVYYRHIIIDNNIIIIKIMDGIRHRKYKLITKRKLNKKIRIKTERDNSLELILKDTYKKNFFYKHGILIN